MKKTLLFMFSVILVASLFAIGVLALGEVYDINNDGSVDILDLVCMKRDIATSTGSCSYKATDLSDLISYILVDDTMGGWSPLS